MAGRSLAGAPVTAVASFESGARLRNADLVQPVTQPVTMTPNEHVSGRRLERPIAEFERRGGKADRDGDSLPRLLPLAISPRN